MALQQNANTARISGIHDLLPTMLERPKNPALIASAAGNVHLPVTRGIMAIGDLMWAASQSQEYPGSLDAETFGDLGCLLKHLGETAEAMIGLQQSAEHWIKEPTR